MTTCLTLLLLLLLFRLCCCWFIITSLFYPRTRRSLTWLFSSLFFSVYPNVCTAPFFLETIFILYFIDEWLPRSTPSVLFYHPPNYTQTAFLSFSLFSTLTTYIRFFIYIGHSDQRTDRRTDGWTQEKILRLLLIESLKGGGGRGGGGLSGCVLKQLVSTSVQYSSGYGWWPVLSVFIRAAVAVMDEGRAQRKNGLKEEEEVEKKENFSSSSSSSR